MPATFAEAIEGDWSFRGTEMREVVEITMANVVYDGMDWHLETLALLTEAAERVCRKEAMISFRQLVTVIA